MVNNLFQKYHLPKIVKVSVLRTTEDTYIAKFPELPGCLTEANDMVDLLYQVNDALFTYFDVSRKDLKGVDFLYYPPKDFLRDIQKIEATKTKVQKYVEFHYPYPNCYA